MGKYTATSLALASIFLTACGSSSDGTGANDKTSAFDGVWQAPAYGQVIDYHHAIATMYDYTSDHCLLTQQLAVSAAELEAEGWALSADEFTLRETITVKGIDIKGPVYNRINELPLSCQQNLHISIGNAGYQPDAERDFDMFWQTFFEYYLSFDLKSVDWHSQYASFRHAVAADSSDATLLDVLAAMVEPLKDGHVQIASADDDVDFSNHVTTVDLLTEEFINAHGEVDSEEKYSQYVSYVMSQLELINDIRLSYAVDDDSIQAAANNEVVWYLAPDNIGVLIIDSMVGFSTDDADDITIENELAVLDAAINQALSDLRDTDGLIIDVRNNGGGFDAASQLIVRHFLDYERHLYSKQARLGNARTEPDAYYLSPAAQNNYANNIVLLTSRNTASAAEVFTLMMRNLPHVTIVGEPTQGALSDMLEKTLANGFSFSLSNEFYLSPEGEWFEHSGIPVDHNIPFGTLPQRQNEQDPALEAAHTMLTN